MGNGLFGLLSGGGAKIEVPEGQELHVNKSRCPQNHPCPSVRVCPVGALTQKGFGAPLVDKNKCIKCGKCTKSCPMKALVFE
ncbi:MAG: 4Fe-4S binding protein [Oscillospiraceae bacterium]|nr:4Fe-4S binding protein [Oscillospiraceae bacterium]